MNLWKRVFNSVFVEETAFSVTLIYLIKKNADFGKAIFFGQSNVNMSWNKRHIIFITVPQPVANTLFNK